MITTENSSTRDVLNKMVRENFVSYLLISIATYMSLTMNMILFIPFLVAMIMK